MRRRCRSRTTAPLPKYSCDSRRQQGSCSKKGRVLRHTALSINHWCTLEDLTPPRAAATDQNATVAAGFLGCMLDAFDFFLVVIPLTAIAKEFQQSYPAIALSSTLPRAFRPVSAFTFTLTADRSRRTVPL